MSSITIAYTLLLPTSATMSFIASSTILYKILSSPTKLKSPYTRLLTGLSGYDMLSSLSLMFSSTAAPRTSSAWGAVGTDETCSMQGFVMLVGQIGAPFYNLGLCIYYLCIIKYSMPDERFSLKIEPYIHIFTGVFALFVAIFSLSTGSINVGSINRVEYSCYLSPHPITCTVEDDVECIRGSLAPLLQVVLVFIPLTITMIGIFVVLAVISAAIRFQENRMAQYIFRLRDGQTSRRQLNSRNRKVMLQALSYATAIAICHSPALIFFFVGSPVMTNNESPSIPAIVMILQAILTPLQGFFNVMIYIRPQICNIRNGNSELTWKEAFFIALNTIDIADNRERSRRMRRSSRHSESIGRLERSKR